jgi:hypothetical protein
MRCPGCSRLNKARCSYGPGFADRPRTRRPLELHVAGRLVLTDPFEAGVPQDVAKPTMLDRARILLRQLLLDTPVAIRMTLTAAPITSAGRILSVGALRHLCQL